MVVLPAGTWKEAEGQVRTLHSGARICPRDYASGFALECRNGMVPPVRFFVDGKYVRDARNWPYTLGTHNDGYRWRYRAYKMNTPQSIECRSSHGGPQQTARVTFSCTGKPTIATFSDSHSTSTPEPKPSDSPQDWYWPGDRGCVVINASRPLGGPSYGWTREDDGGLTFRAGDPYEGIVQPGTSKLTYSFEVPQKSTYGVSVDMTTRGWTEHNDIFLRFQYGGGFVLKRPGSTVTPGTAFTKAYHNNNGRKTEAKSVDNNGHSFSTIAELEPGVKYYITVGGRSTKTTVHNIILFPCRNGQCSSFDRYWQGIVHTCK